MLSKKSFGIAGAAMLGSVALLGTNAANAVINLDAASKADAVATFAEETVTATVESSASGTFYMVTGETGVDGTLNVYGAIGVGATQDTEVEVTFDLTNMVFGAQVVATNISLYPAPTAPATFDTGSPGVDKLGAGERSVITGGAAGSSSVTFHISNSDEEAVEQGDIVHLTVASLGVVRGCGSVSVSAENTVSETTASSSYMDAVCIARGIREVVKPNNPTTEVERGYTDFGLHARMVDNSGNTDEGVTDLAVGDNRYSASLGSIQIEVRHLNAADGTAAMLDNVLTDDAFNDRSTADLIAAAARNAGIQFVGMFDELEPEEVYLNSMPECAMRDTAEDAPNLYTPPNPDRGSPKGKVRKVALNELLPDAAQGSGEAMMTDTKHVCIRVADEDSQSEGYMIPSTPKFEAITSYVGMGGAASALTAAGTTSELGRVIRDGVEVWLPYLTTDARYNQRIIMVNESASAAAYRLDFTGESGITVVAGTRSHGVLGADSTTVLNLTKDDVMSIVGGPPNRASAVLIIEASPGQVSVATNQTNRDTGSTDTVVYTEE